MAGSYSNSIFYFMRNLHNVLKNDCTKIHFGHKGQLLQASKEVRLHHRFISRVAGSQGSCVSCGTHRAGRCRGSPCGWEIEQICVCVGSHCQRRDL